MPCPNCQSVNISDSTYQPRPDRKVKQCLRCDDCQTKFVENDIIKAGPSRNSNLSCPICSYPMVSYGRQWYCDRCHRFALKVKFKRG